MDKDGSQLLRRLRKKDDEAMVDVLNRHKKRIKAFIESRVPRDGRADDLTQSTFETFVHLVEMRGPRELALFPSIAQLLFLIASRRMIDDARSEISRQEMLDSYATYPMTPPRRPDEILLSKEAEEQVRLEADKLDPRRREIVVLAILDECTTEEMVKLTELSPTTVRTRFRSGLQLLASAVAPYLKGDL